MGSGTLERVPHRLILASASTARLRVLESAGLHPQVMVSDVEENGVEHLPTSQAVLDLARRKAQDVASRAATIHRSASPTDAPTLVIGCDSLLEFDGESLGKPPDAAEATRRWRSMRGNAGLLHTGHWVVDTGTGRGVGATDTTLVRFGNPTDAEIDAYVATGEPLQVAGAFTLEGRAAPWVESIDGNHGTVLGLSLPVLRRLLAELGVDLVDLWS